MVWLTLLVAVLNICLGFAVAVALGYGPPGWWEAREPPGSRSPPPEEEFQGLVQELAQGPATAMLDDGGDEATEIDPYDEPYDDDAADFSQVALENPEDWNLNEKYIETSILKLNIAMIRSGRRCTDLDTRLRACQGRSDRETIVECLEKLREDCELYLAEQTENAARFHDRISELGELSALGGQIEAANLEQAAQVETTLNNLKRMDSVEPEAANRRLIEEINNLRVARHRLRDNQEAAFLAVARYENRVGKIERQLSIDPLTKLRNRIGLEMQLDEWWNRDRSKTRQMSAAMFDLDRFGAVNESYGSLIGDRILYETAQWLHRSVGPGDTVARYGGQRFFVLMLDVGPRQAMKSAEKLRQQFSKLVFARAGTRIKLTTEAGITDIKTGEQYTEVLERLEAALRYGKAQGAGQGTYYPAGGEGPEPTGAPNFGCKPMEIAI